MNELKWQKVQKVVLSGGLISVDPQERPGDLKAEIADAEVAFQGAFLFIAPAATSGDHKPPVTVVPAEKLVRLTYEGGPAPAATPWVERG
ncbi:hypothetical protein ACFRFJ_16330 [Streptomyces hydrogenans]|uniref:hypothetical protein n=1 Tax=Streptomyces hydrogenans TaxID=1873719 RepID=UPI0036C407A0